MSFIKGASAVAALVLLPSSAMAATNLVVSGNFENVTLGTTFRSDYTYGNFKNLSEGRYSVTDDAFKLHNRWRAVGQGGSGQFFVANGSNTSKVAWQQTISGVVANQAYFFEAFIADLSDKVVTPGQLSTVEFLALQDGVTTSLGQYRTKSGTFDANGVKSDYWVGVSNTFLSKSNSDVTLFLKNISKSGNGNDFGLDTVNFSLSSVVNPGNVLPPVGGAVPEPSTWLMLIAGFGLIGGTMRRRTRIGAFA